MLVGAAQPAHILTPTVTVRGIVNMSALAVVEAQAARRRPGPSGVTDCAPDDLTDAASDSEEDEVSYGVSPETVQTARGPLEAHQGQSCASCRRACMPPTSPTCWSS